MRALDAVREAERELAGAGVPSPRADAELLVADVLGGSRSGIYASERELREAELRRLRTLVDRRRRREPLAYVLGEWGFRRLSLAVDPRVLVPRPETETVVERCLALLADVEEPRMLDIGTGSGAIALALADERPDARVTAVDVSDAALAVTRENARRHGLDDRVAFVLGDLAADVPGPFDLVVSNPPYVRPEEIGGLEPEVRDWEPRGALVARGMGKQVARVALDLLVPGGRVVLECGDGQADDVAADLCSLGYDDVTVTPDLGGIDRVVDGGRP